MIYSRQGYVDVVGKPEVLLADLTFCISKVYEISVREGFSAPCVVEQIIRNAVNDEIKKVNEEFAKQGDPEKFQDYLDIEIEKLRKVGN